MNVINIVVLLLKCEILKVRVLFIWFKEILFLSEAIAPSLVVALWIQAITCFGQIRFTQSLDF